MDQSHTQFLLEFPRSSSVYHLETCSKNYEVAQLERQWLLPAEEPTESELQAGLVRHPPRNANNFSIFSCSSACHSHYCYFHVYHDDDHRRRLLRHKPRQTAATTTSATRARTATNAAATAAAVTAVRLQWHKMKRLLAARPQMRKLR